MISKAICVFFTTAKHTSVNRRGLIDSGSEFSTFSGFRNGFYSRMSNLAVGRWFELNDLRDGLNEAFFLRLFD